MEFAWPGNVGNVAFGWKPVPENANKRYNTILKHTRLLLECTNNK
jgi:hypothetical protein